jgi:predicted transcriptional regulator
VNLMANSIASPALSSKRKMLAASFAAPKVAGEAVSKKLAEQQIGRVITRVIEHSGFTQKEIAFRLGYEDQSAVSRWVAGVDNASALGRLWALLELRESIIVALAENAESRAVEVRTIVTVTARKVVVA